MWILSNIIGIVVCAALVAYTLLALPRDGRTNALAILCTGVAMVHLYELAGKTAPDAETVEVWRSFLHGSHTLASVGAILFGLHYMGASKVARSRAFVILLWSWALLLTLFQSSPLIERSYEWRAGIGWFPLYDNRVRSFVIVNNFVGGAALVVGVGSNLVRHWNDLEIRRRGQALLVGASITIGAGAVTDVMLPILGVHSLPRTFAFAFLAFLGFLVWAVSRYELLTFSMEAASSAALERITDAVMVLSETGRVLDRNPASTEILPNPTSFLERILRSEAWSAAIRGEASTGLRCELGTEPGRVLQVTLAPISDDERRTTVVCVLHDVTELERARAEAEAANTAKSVFLANMSHELRTPLNAVLGYSEMLAEDLPEHEDDLNRIHRSGAYLLSLIDDILDLSKVSAGRMELQLDAIPVEPLVAEAREATLALFDKAGTRLELAVEQTPTLLGDRVRTKQILLNLLSNAAKFSGGEPVRLEVGRCEGGAELSVVDRGVGMDSDQVARLFGVFSQVHRSGHAEYGGTGLGLALSRELARQMGGDIVVQSQLGVGSRFTLTLPESTT